MDVQQKTGMRQDSPSQTGNPDGSETGDGPTRSSESQHLENFCQLWVDEMKINGSPEELVESGGGQLASQLPFPIVCLKAALEARPRLRNSQ